MLGKEKATMKKILLVEDDETLSASYIQRFIAEGFEVERVPNGEEALEAAIKFKPNLILLDIMMPKVNGFDVLDILRNTPETVNSRIVVLSALSQQEDIDKARQLGADDYLVKSQVVLADVVERVKQHLGEA
jgi:DNA-binding response OmpR family regulator